MNEENKKEKSKRDKAGIFVFGLVFVAISVLGLILPLRPTTSELEKRDLNEFPTFSWEAFWDGSWCSDISLWYSDTFPFRDRLLSGNAAMQEYYGIRTTQIHGAVSSGDDIPDVPNVNQDETEVLETEESSSTDKQESTPEMTAEETAETTAEVIQTDDTEEESSKEPETQEESPSNSNNVVGEQAGAIYIVGNTAYEIYYFSLTAADIYINAINRVADALEGVANVYVMTPPTSFGLYIDDETRVNLDGSSEQKAEQYYLGSMNKNVNPIYLYDTLSSHKDEYIYFRTDHHWTADGAYYAYEEFAKEKGFTPNKREEFEKREYSGFAGSFYAGTNQTKVLMDNPDTITAYVPKSTNLMQFTSIEGETLNWYIIFDVTNYNHGNKYSCFIAGDNPISVIENPKLNDGSSCVLIKDSYGNAFAPYLVDHYQTIYILDYRYYTDNFTEFVRSHEVDDVIFINNLSSMSSTAVMEQFDAKMTQ